MTHATLCCDGAIATAGIPAVQMRSRVHTPCRADRVHIPPTDVWPQLGFDGTTLFTPTPHWAGVIIG